MAMLPQTIYRFKTISTKIPMAFFIKIETLIITFILSRKNP
jgi:hypothetical protein